MTASGFCHLDLVDDNLVFVITLPAPPLPKWFVSACFIIATGKKTKASNKSSLYSVYGKQTPSDFLKQIIGRPVVVKLNSGVDYRGVLACLDSYMNIALEQMEEYVNGQLKNKYGDEFIRGNNVLYISTQKRSM
ncbi:U6 snRNA-associated Sm-like protein LSm6 [Peromyscus leucopus]|uniref:U6 snRNA-associated Sm-like protein LSm6 n=1 Tax=Peromyscus leucopus TaxID=10041 RepID=UPI0018854740|nr:U6 snRNA-associated Sm-like protein LSm6 [Peromyscus leucopus]